MRSKKFSSIGRDLTFEVADGFTYKTSRIINKIAVHCSFSPQDRGDDAHTIDRWHKQRWGSGIGYHYVILEDGTIQKGRWVDSVGAHVKGHNTGSIGICRIGGKSYSGKEVFDATKAQERSLNNLLLILLKNYSLTPEDVLGHNEFPNVYKSCPLMDMRKVRSNLKK